MFDLLRQRVLALLKVPAEPHPPMGDPASLRIFRAGRNYYRLRMTGWAVAQAFALAGILFWSGVLIEVERNANAEEARATATPAPTVATETPATPATTSAARKRAREQRVQQWQKNFVKNVTAAANHESNSRLPFARSWAAAKRVCVEVALIVPPWVFPLVWALKITGFLVYFVQLGVTYAVRRLDYEMRWYLVTDRSLRLRHGVWVVWESTMSFANVQQVIVSQGPLQRLLGLANVKVQSAGGGTGKDQHQRDDMHVGYFHSVTNADEIRDLILDRLRRFRESGLGDPDEKATQHPAPAASVRPATLLAAARELAAEAKALRATLGAR